MTTSEAIVSQFSQAYLKIQKNSKQTKWATISLLSANEVAVGRTGVHILAASVHV